ncbi:endonuclease MutS2 [Lachnoanaerobaculum saburreum]|uniref:Endonuclease MutS2 n=1 Tax=Lachnoanaerobaculum saburreum TaxID=467210 RepID=A0A133ZC14_9FIRM|nr:endonuclease MutS2 [Lachnoanaerobaculum saburreum]KXB52974.1 phage terminase, small subunit, P27 family [Lachnoanaerobaculum saburreum]
MNKKTLKILEFEKIINSLVDMASSEPAKKLCSKLKPSTDIAEIQKNQSHTTAALDRIRLKGNLSLSEVKDIKDSLKRLEIGSSLSQVELMKILSILNAAAKAASYGLHEDDPEYDVLEEYFITLDDCKPLKKELSRCIISEEIIADNASPELSHIRRKINQINSKMHTELNNILNAHREYLMDAVITQRDGAYCLPIKSEYKNKVSGVVHDQSSTGSTVFIEPLAVIRMNNELKSLAMDEKKEIEKILERLSLLATEYTTVLDNNAKNLIYLDFVYAKANLSKKMNGSEPKFNSKHYINIKEGRHPLLDAKKVVPINISLGDTYDLLIITGPNTGGKTVSLKTVGLFTIMGQSGLHIPAFEGSELSVFGDVFADIGDEQSIEQSLSTFSGHMKNIVYILNHADANSLCLFDELCAGTDPTEGAALAISILSFLHRMQSRCIATTHYSELKVFALNEPGVENASCEFDVATLSPTYRILIGVPGKSNAFAIAGKLGLPDYIISEAGTHLEKDAKDFEDLLTRLENDRQIIEKDKLSIQKYKREIESLKRHYDKQEENLTAKKEKILEEARESARKILEEAKETADDTIKNINKIASGAGLGSALEEQRTRLRESINKNTKSVEVKKPTNKLKKPKELKLGDSVHVISLNLDGIVSSLPNQSGNLFVQMGILRSQVNISDIALVEEPAKKTENKTRSRGSSMVKSATISTEINLIGKNVDEACSELDKYLDDALLAHLPGVRIIHGRGTGALQKGIHAYLKRQSFIKSYSLADFNEGGNAVTIVHFK